jgi:hypothetical protein
MAKELREYGFTVPVGKLRKMAATACNIAKRV